MCDVRPFPGLRYRINSNTDISSLVTPPYDVISAEDRVFYYQSHPHNVIRLEYGEERPDDSPISNKYTRAAATLDSWLKGAVLAPEEKPAFYVVEHCFPYHNCSTSRWGLLARVKMEELGRGQIKPHEKTLREPAIDRFNLLKACRANSSPIMGMIPSDHGDLSTLLQSMATGKPVSHATDSYGVTYRLWVITDQERTSAISRYAAGRAIYIADGHHRYETAFRYSEEQRTLYPGNEERHSDFVMMSLMDSQDPGLIMLPTHRLVKGTEEEAGQIEKKLSPYLSSEHVLAWKDSSSETIQLWLRTLLECGRSGAVFGVYGLRGQELCLLRLRKDIDPDTLAPPDEPDFLKTLDVNLLHRVVLGQALGIEGPEKEKQHLEYVRDELEVVDMVNSGQCDIAFFLNPTPVSCVIAAADAGKRLPQKTTYFYPKTPAGLVINPLW